MRFPARALYACKAITELALNYNNTSPVQIQTISRNQNIPRKFLAQILIQLKNAKIVTSLRGSLGGYRLLKDPSKLSIANVVIAVDDSIIALDDIKKSHKSASTDKYFNSIWSDMNKEIALKLKNTKFNDVIDKIKEEEFTYHI